MWICKVISKKMHEINIKGRPRTKNLMILFYFSQITSNIHESKIKTLLDSVLKSAESSKQNIIKQNF